MVGNDYEQLAEHFYRSEGVLKCFVDRFGKIFHVDLNWQELGWSSAELLGKPLIDFFNNDSQASLKQELWSTLNGGDVGRKVSLSVMKSDGGSVCYDWQFKAFGMEVLCFATKCEIKSNQKE